MTDSWIILLPPLIVLLSAAISRNVVGSLILGVLSAAFIATDFSIAQTITHTISRIITEATKTDTLYLFSFLVLLGIIIEIMTHAGGIVAFNKALRKKISTKRDTETTSLLLSFVFFLDDYLNGLTVGSIMRSLTDSMKIPRAKLAFLINSMSAPLCLLIPATTWVAMVLGQLQAAGMSDELADHPVINADPLNTYLQTIPYLFYPIFIIFSAWFIVRRQIAFGAMRQYELIAEETDNLFGDKKPLHKQDSAELKHGSISGFFIPIGLFVGSMLLYLFYSGNAFFLGGTNTLMTALKTADSFWALFMAGLTTTAVTAPLFVIQGTLSWKEFAKSCWKGLTMMKTSMVVLLLAYTLSSILIDDLHSGTYLATVILNILPLFALPAIIFLVTTLITAATGSSWGTIAVMFPLTIRMLVGIAGGGTLLLISNIPFFFPVIGALLAGSVAGAHFSPITDSTIMASTSTGCYHMDHVQTQISYAFPALLGSLTSFLILGIFPALGYFVAFGTGLTITMGILLIRNQQ